MEYIENWIQITLGWPVWAFRTIEILCLVLFFTSLSQYRFIPEVNKLAINSKPTKAFRLFQLQYLSVFLLTMLADWLQGTNMYTLYASYKVDIGTLFLTGFLSSAIFGTFLGIYVDRWGRRLGCIFFCVLEIIINLLEHLPSMPPLLIGRILGGLSTSLLFSAFESWMVSEHRNRGFPEELLADTFAISSWGNGVMAICAGILAQASSDVAGDIGPFQVAIAITILCGAMICFWPENYGYTSSKSEKKEKENDNNNNQSLVSSFITSYKVIINSPHILYLGLGQAVFEGAVYTFVFMWVPSLLAVSTGNLPTGLIFSCFMLAMTIGGMLFGIILPVFPGNAEALCAAVYFVAACAMVVPYFWFEFWPVFISFLVLEGMVGMFFSCSATLRSRYYPEDLQSSIMSVFRLPLNILVVVGTKLSDRAKDIPALQNVFLVVVCVHLFAFALQLLLIFLPLVTTSNIAKARKSTQQKSNKKKK